MSKKKDDIERTKVGSNGMFCEGCGDEVGNNEEGNNYSECPNCGAIVCSECFLGESCTVCEEDND